MKRWHGACLLILSCWLDAAHSESPNFPSGSVCWPLHFAGITVGTTTDSQVQRLLGQGVFGQHEGDTGGRYFIDLKGSITLHAVSYTDRVVGELTLLPGIDPAIRVSERKSAMTKWLDPDEGFGNWHALRLGSSKEKVFKNLGKPKKKSSDDQWTYHAICSCEIQDFFTLYFQNGRLSKIVLSAPAG